MELQDNSHSLFSVSLDENVKKNLRGAAKWAGNAALVGLVGTILSVVVFIVGQSRTSTRYQSSEGFNSFRSGGASQSDGLPSLVIGLIIGIALFYFLNKFSKTTIAGLDGGDSPTVSEGIGNLATYFKIIGVIFIVMIVVVFLGVLVAIGSKA
jgi:hypothetical protein